MLNFKKSFVSLLLVATVLLSCLSFAVLDVSATEAPSVNDDPTITIYYFYDLFPTLSKDTLSATFESEGWNVDLVYYRGYLDIQLLNILLNDNYFDDSTDYCMVIADIKTKCPSSGELTQLFQKLKIERQWYTGFVTSFYENDFENCNFDIFLDIFVTSALYNVYYRLLDDAFSWMNNEVLAVTNSVFILDETWVDVSGYTNFDTLYSSSICLRIFVQRLLNYAIDPDDIYPNDNAICEFLSSKNIVILVRRGGYEYIDIISGGAFEIRNDSDLNNSFLTGKDNYYVMGFWRLSEYLYYAVDMIQDNYPNNTYVFVYPLEPIVYDPNGIEVIICGTGDNGGYYDYDYDEAADILIDAITSWIRGILSNS